MDRSVVERAKGGDVEAFTNLVHEISGSLFAVAYRILRESSAAEDALQNALLSTWQQLPRLRDIANFEAWTYRILVRACYAESGRRRLFTANVRALDGVGPSSTDGARALVDRDELGQAFSQIPVEQRAVFVLHHYLGLPLVEIAEILGIPAGTARSRLYTATRSLRTVMEASALQTLEEGRTA